MNKGKWVPHISRSVLFMSNSFSNPISVVEAEMIATGLENFHADGKRAAPFRTARYTGIGNRTRLDDRTGVIVRFLTNIGIRGHQIKNDAPRGSATGNYIHIPWTSRNREIVLDVLRWHWMEYAA